MVHGVLRAHARELGEVADVRVDIEEDGLQRRVILREVSLPSGAYRLDKSDVLFLTDAQYPVSAMDMFWTDVAVLLANGSVPAGAESIEMYAGRQWRRFSWHRNGVWSPNGNPLIDHFEFMQERFAKDVNS